MRNETIIITGQIIKLRLFKKAQIDNEKQVNKQHIWITTFVFDFKFIAELLIPNLMSYFLSAKA